VARFAGYFCGLTLVEVEDEVAYLAAADNRVYAEHQERVESQLDTKRTTARGGDAKTPKPPGQSMT